MLIEKLRGMTNLEHCYTSIDMRIVIALSVLSLSFCSYIYMPECMYMHLHLFIVIN